MKYKIKNDLKEIIYLKFINQMMKLSDYDLKFIFKRKKNSIYLRQRWKHSKSR